jgi:hypothetical protein
MNSLCSRVAGYSRCENAAMWHILCCVKPIAGEPLLMPLHCIAEREGFTRQRQAFYPA